MTKENLECPICGSKQIKRFEKDSFGKLTLGEMFPYLEVFYRCESCNEEYDLFAETDKNYLVAQKKAQAVFVNQILNDLNKSGIKMATLERIFELPIRTLTRWKSGDFSSSALALLRIIFTFPWIVQVADNKFEKQFAKYAVITAAAEEFRFETNRETIPPATIGSAGKIIQFDFQNKLKSG